MRVLLTGARGFIGGQILASLVSAGHKVVPCVRGSFPPASDDVPSLACDFARDTDPSIWLPRLEGIDAVVNCAGILRERGTDRFEQVHVEAPLALYHACVTSGVRRVIQISALGHPEETQFIASKHRGDAKLAKLDLDWVILRPSVVYSADGSYGGTSLLRAMAALPGVIFLPGGGQQQIAPVSAADLGALIVCLLEPGADSHRTFEVVGPETMSLERYLRLWRRWLGFSEPRVIRIPMGIVATAARFGERFGSGPLGMTLYRMLIRGSTAGPGADVAVGSSAAWRPRSLNEVLSQRPSLVQDRWHARLYFLAPMLRMSLGLVWAASALVGFLTPQQQMQAILGSAGVTSGAVALVYAASALDLILGAALLLRTRVAATGALMLISLAVYTLFIGVKLPSIWLEPFGGLLKNLVLIPAVLVMMVVADRK